MSELQFADGVLARIRANGGHFDERGYLFVLAAIEYLQSRLEVRRHVTGAELAWACRDFAVRQFGLMAETVLRHWGLTRTDDFGRSDLGNLILPENLSVLDRIGIGLRRPNGGKRARLMSPSPCASVC